MTLEELQKEWEKDSEIDDEMIDMESLKTHKLHSKYLNLLSNEKVAYLKYDAALNKLEDILDRYYGGSLDGKDINRPPFKLKADTKSSREKLIKADDQFQKLNFQKSLCLEKILFLKEVLISINQRGYSLTNTTNYRKFISGQ